MTHLSSAESSHQPEYTLDSIQQGLSLEFTDGKHGTLVTEVGAVIDIDDLLANPITLDNPMIVITENGHYATDGEILTSLPRLNKQTGKFGTQTDRLLVATFESGNIGQSEPFAVGSPWVNISRLTRGDDQTGVRQVLFGCNKLQAQMGYTAPTKANVPSPFESARLHIDRIKKNFLGRVALY